MDVLLGQIREGLDYLTIQGKKVNKIKMNPNIFEKMTNKLMDVEVSEGAITVFGITIEADKNIEVYAFVMDEVT
ncbi:lactate dehydrogenase [Solibacillus sp. FSL K6-1554]|uniref:lactate dehydrogenase n=1 Tax=Solibacillus sp. FSL K6-1554 TaxID=2921472 RepID=UPI0030FCEE88